MNPIKYQYWKGLQNNRIIINDPIDADTIETAIVPLLDMDADPNVKHIDIFINTVGGSQYVGMPLCDIIDGLKTETTVTAIAYALSMGSLILMGGFNNPNVKDQCGCGEE